MHAPSASSQQKNARAERNQKCSGHARSEGLGGGGEQERRRNFRQRGRRLPSSRRAPFCITVNARCDWKSEQGACSTETLWAHAVCVTADALHDWRS